MECIIEQLKIENIPFEENISLKEKTWIRTGGVVSLWITPINTEQLVKSISVMEKFGEEFELTGYTSNIYYLDEYNPRVIISTIKIKDYKDTDEYIDVSCGCSVSILSHYCVDRGYIGYSGLVNLPGTVGAAICNNSSCFGCSISEHVVDATFYNTETHHVQILRQEDFGFQYRNSKLKTKELKGVIISVRLSKFIGSIKEEKAKAYNAIKIRKETQEPAAFTLGSVYAGLTPKKDIRGFLIHIGGGKLLKLFRVYSKSRYIKMVLFLYGYKDLIEFVSLKVINTFKWLPNRCETYEKFQRYQAFVKKAFVSPRLEIEIRNGN